MPETFFFRKSKALESGGMVEERPIRCHSSNIMSCTLK